MNPSDIPHRYLLANGGFIKGEAAGRFLNETRLFWPLVCFALLIAMSLPAKVLAQVATTATLNGTVRDSSGAVVPGATIKITNEDTKVVTSTKSNSAGSFAVPSLSVGSYTITVTRQGFQTYVVSGIILHPGIVTTTNAVLKVGQPTTQVTVSAGAAQVQTSTSEVSNEVSEKQVMTLPLNGRNYQSLSALMPGVTNLDTGRALATGGFGNGNAMSINGSGIRGTMYYVDGVWNENTGSMASTTITPNPDAIQEVRVLQNNYGVQYSLNGANVVLVQTKSGTSQFHGKAFEYLRNDALDARNFFSPDVPPLKQNIFGYTLGGPIYIPHHFNTKKNKVFFFWSQQWTRQHVGHVLRGATPTAAMRNGTFDTPITDPTTAAPFPQTSPGIYQIPQGSLNSSTLAFMSAVMPLPNNPSGGFLNYINNDPVINNIRDDQIKVDYNINAKFRIMGEYFDSRSTNLSPNNGSSPFDTIRLLRTSPLQLAQLRLTQTYSPSLVNVTSISMNNYVTTAAVTGTTLRKQVPGFKEVLPFEGGFASNELPFITFAQGWSPAGVIQNFPQYHAGDLEDSLSDSLSYLHGNHYFQAGFQYVRGNKRQWSFVQSHGQWSFNGQFTGNAMADFLLGTPSQFFQGSTRPRFYVFYPIVSPYFQDQWKATRRLTITAGLRYEYMPALHPARGTMSMFDPAKYDPAHAPIVNNNGTITPTPSYNPLNGLVINGENGVPLNFSDAHKNYWAPSVGFAWDVFGNGKTSLRGGYGITYYNMFSSSCKESCATNPPFVNTLTLIQPSFPNPVGTGSVAPSAAPTLHGMDLLGWQSPQVQTYSLSLEHQFGQHWLASLTGAGNIVRHLSANWNINQPLPDAPYDFNPVINSGSVFTYLFGPYLGYGPINTATYNSNAYWNALEAKVRHPVGHNLFLSVAYTWQHGLSDNGYSTQVFGTSGIQDIYNPSADYGNTAVNVPQILSLSGIWSLPWYKGARGLQGTVLGGWQFSDITTIQSGFSLSPGLSISHRGLASRPNAAANMSINGPKTVNEWFNKAAFAAPAAGFFGNAAPGSIRGPGAVNFNMAFYKDFHINERNTIQFRGELFNVFNHTNFSGVSTGFGAGNYGHVTSALDPRIVEFALRYQF